MTAAEAMEPAWRDLPRATPLLAWSRRELELAARALGEMVRSWSRDWDLRVAEEVLCTIAADVPSGRDAAWECLGSSPRGGAAWLQWDPAQTGRMARDWFGEDAQETPVVASVIDACRKDAAHRMAQALALAPAPDLPVDAAAWSPWGGAVIASHPVGGALLMEGPVIRRLLEAAGSPKPRRPGGTLVPVHEALGAAPMPLQVELEGCELDLGELEALQAGDVLRLRHRVDAPVLVMQPDGRLLLGGWLARTRGRRAIELVPATAVTREEK